MSGAIPMLTAPVDQPARGAGSIDLMQMRFDVDVLDVAIGESGLVSEFDLDVDDMRRLAVMANALVSVGLCAPDDEEFDRALESFEPVRDCVELGFMFGYCEHVRQELLRELQATDRIEDLRLTMGRRIKTAHARFQAGLVED